MSEKVVAQDMVIGINYVLRLDDGTIIDQAAADDPLLYLHGHGNIISGLESELTGLQVGDRKSVTVEPTDAYGEYNPDDVEQHPRDMFPADMDWPKTWRWNCAIPKLTIHTKLSSRL